MPSVCFFLEANGLVEKSGMTLLLPNPPHIDQPVLTPKQGNRGDELFRYSEKLNYRSTASGKTIS